MNDTFLTEYAKEHPSAVKVIMTGGADLHYDVIDFLNTKVSSVEIVGGVICHLTTEEVDEIVLDFSSAFRKHYKDNFNEAYYKLCKYLSQMQKEHKGEFIRSLIDDKDMLKAMDQTMKESDSVFAKFANKLNLENVLVIDDKDDSKQSAEQVRKILEDCYAPSSVTVITSSEVNRKHASDLFDLDKIPMDELDAAYQDYSKYKNR